MSNRCRAEELASHLQNHLTRLGITPEQLNWELGDLTVIPGGFMETEDGLHYAALRYGSVFHFNNLPLGKLTLLGLLIQNFLDQQDSGRSSSALAPVKLQFASAPTGSSANLNALVEFIDPIILVENASGPVIFQGKTYDFGTAVIDVAETVDAVYADRIG